MKGDKGDKIMDIKNINIYNMPKWFSNIMEEVDLLCKEALESSVSYNKITEEQYRIVDRHRFVSKLAVSDTVEESMELSAEESKALSRFISLENDKAKAEGIQMYLLGCSHIYKLLRSLEEI